MKTLEQIKEEVYKEHDVEHECDIYEYIIDDIAKRYATEYAKEALRLASENAKTDHGYFSDGSTAPVRVVDKHSILSENNLPKHR